MFSDGQLLFSRRRRHRRDEKVRGAIAGRVSDGPAKPEEGRARTDITPAHSIMRCVR